jgi:hypothetical protein
MASDKALYWIAVFAMALGISNDYRQGGFPVLHGHVDRALAVARDYSRCAERYLATAEVMLGRGQATLGQAQAGLGQAQAVLGREQARLALVQAEMARREVEKHWPEIERAQRLAAEKRILVCPHSGRLDVRIPRLRVQVDPDLTETLPLTEVLPNVAVSV